MAELPKDQTLSGLNNITVHTTGHDEAGNPIILSSTTPQWSSYAGDKVGMSILYTTDFNANLNNNEDVKKHEEKMSKGHLGLVNPKGCLLRMVDIAPANEAFLHQTKSIDFGVVVKGELHNILPSGEKAILKAGDVCIQRGTSHGWHNPHPTEWARIAFFLQDIEPIEINGKKLGEDFHGQDANIPPSGN